MNVPDLRNQRIGLVLSGGGAKGAYHIGCWKALRASGLDQFQAIAGSSVGAINAVFVASGRLDVVEDAWRRLRIRDVIGLSLKSALRLPAWLVAGLGSEFSPFKITRLADRVGTGRAGWLHPLLCAVAAAGLWMAFGVLPAAPAPWAPLVAAVPLALAALTQAHRLTRPIFLRPVFTDNGPLARTLARLVSEADLQALRKAGRPVYGVLSQYVPGAAGAHRWSGWRPRYVRLDHAPDAGSLRRTLVEGSAVPGFLRGGSLDGRPVLDGAWTDNVPAGPLLFGDHDLDVIIVVYLKQTVRHTPRHNSLCAVLGLLVREAVAGLDPHADIHTWARARWETSCGAVLPDDGGRRPPLILSVAPSRRIGNFFSGTLWFARAKSASLIDLGERDMRAALARLSDIAVAAPADAFTSRRRPRDTPAAAPPPAPASPPPSALPAIWRSPEGTAVE